MKFRKILIIAVISGILLLSETLVIIERYPIEPYALANRQLSATAHIVTSGRATNGSSGNKGSFKELSSSTHSRQPTETRVPGISANSSILWPNCLSNIGWYHGWHGNIFEYGADYDCGYHTTIPALWAGTVIESGRTCWNSSCSSSSGGVVVVVAYVPGFGMESTYYLHLDWSFLNVGQQIAKGTLVGLTGAQVGYGHWPTSPWFTGGPHLEVGWCAAFLPCPVGSNSNPEQAVRDAIS